MINLNDIENLSELKALSLLKNYEGNNFYLIELKNNYKQNQKIKLSENLIEYIINNYDKEPILINRIVKITDFWAKELQKKYNLTVTPQRILIQYILGETNKFYHIYGKLTQKSHSKIYWLPKTQLIDDPFFEVPNIDIDFEKYQKLDKLKRVLFNHQKDGIKFLVSRKHCILGDQMGLGKTIQSIIAALEVNAQKILIVCPASVKITWMREIKNFTDNVSIINGIHWNTSKFTIINYDILKYFHPQKKNKFKVPSKLKDEGFDLVIIDEAHYLKEHTSIRTKIMLDVCKDVERVWLLTGTPVVNQPMDFYNLLKLLKSPLANNWKYYVTRYCDAKKIRKQLNNGKIKTIWITSGASNLDELHQKTKNYILRRLKDDVLDLPPKTIIPLYYDLTHNEYAEYLTLWDEYVKKIYEDAILENKTINLNNLVKELIEIILLRKYVAMKMIPNTIDLAENIIQNGHKVVIFTNFTDELMELYENFGNKSVIHYGDMSTTEKQKSIDEFMNNPQVKIFIGNQKSAGVGITLTSANYIIFNSYDWVPGNNEQCEDRCHRISQSKNVTIYYQLFNNTISFRVWEVLQNKTATINEIIKASLVNKD